MQIIEKAVNEPKLASAAASLVKRFDERSAGQAAKNEMDRTDGSDNAIKFVIVQPPPNVLPMPPEQPRPTRPSTSTS
ncbi:MAG: hypothetical protein DMG98_27460 [Acidobacteria bacterium]|nr:MAG: hypothetical protein DMG98_27460 [Acidobacteriota bacterium]